MKFYEQMNPVDRKIMLLKAVSHDAAMEGMVEESAKCLVEAIELQKMKFQIPNCEGADDPGMQSTKNIPPASIPPE